MQIAKGLQLAEQIKQSMQLLRNEYLKRLADALNPCHYIAEKIFKEIIDNPPVAANKGNVIKKGVHAELDELRNIATRRQRISC